MTYFEFPHCNSEVLHAPGTCVYCDDFPDKQTARAVSGTPFTPAEANGWSGNVAVADGEVHSHMGATFIARAKQVDSEPSRLSLIRRIRAWIWLRGFMR
jgi:hypothetical protein